GPGRLSMDGALTEVGFAELAVAAVHEGCVGETLAAALASERSERASDPFLRRALAKIAEDETRHAALAWRTVAWAIHQGGPDVADAVRTAFTDAVRPYLDEVRDQPSEAADARDRVLLEHGHLPNRMMRHLAR